MEKLLTAAFLRGYPDHPAHMTPLGMFTFYRTYSRFLPDERRRETWKETAARTVEYNVGLEITHREKIGLPVNMRDVRKEAEALFHSVFNLRQFPSGRTLWVGGTPVAEEYPMSNFNCSFTNIEKWDDLGELFYLLMLGSGVGFKCTPDMAAKLPAIRTNTTLILSEYKPVPVAERLERTEVKYLDNGYAKIYVGDSKEGWRDALVRYLKLLTIGRMRDVHTVKISFNSVRPKGERLKRFGGTASGPEPLMEMFAGIDNVLKNKIDPSLAPIETDADGYGHVRPIHILDIGNLIGNNVVSGGVRRTAEIFLFDPSDIESLFAKYGINGFWSDAHFAQHEAVKKQFVKLEITPPAWFDKLGIKSYDPAVNGSRPFNWGRTTIGHRRLSNNSMALEFKPSPEFLHLIFSMIQLDGEPGFVNLEAARKRRENVQGVNPCFRGDMRLLTKDGYKSFAELDGRNVELINKDGNVSNGKVWCSGEKEVWEISFIDRRGSIFVTEDHVFLADSGEEVTTKNLPGCVLSGWEVRDAKSTGKVEKVYDFSEPLTHWGVVEGVIAHNCEEILLDTKQQCNLTTVNLKSFKNPSGFDMAAALNAQELSTRAAIRMTLIDLELPEWNAKQKRDRLTGCSLTGAQDAFTGMTAEQKVAALGTLRHGAELVAAKYAHELRIPSPLLTTTIKPEGTLSLVAGGVSAGLHYAHAPYFIRRIRVSADDALAKMALAVGWNVSPEVGSDSLETARTWVIDFPVASGATTTKGDVSALDQLHEYLAFQNHYTQHNSSNTITVKPDEWPLIEGAISAVWDSFVGVSFLSYDGGTYKLAPYEAITEAEYEELRGKCAPFDPEVLAAFESTGESDISEDADCSTGACPVR